MDWKLFTTEGLIYCHSHPEGKSLASYKLLLQIFNSSVDFQSPAWSVSFTPVIVVSRCFLLEVFHDHVYLNFVNLIILPFT